MISFENEQIREKEDKDDSFDIQENKLIVSKLKILIKGLEVEIFLPVNMQVVSESPVANLLSPPPPLPFDLSILIRI